MLSLTEKRFKELTAEALDSLPEAFAEQLDNVFVEVEDSPSAEDLSSVGMSEHEADELLGLYQGIPQDVRGMDYLGLPDRVVLYRRSILQVCETEDDVRAEVRDTLVHELGHHFGLTDDDMPY